MAELLSSLSGPWKRLSGRERFLAIITLLAALSWPIYQYPYTWLEKTSAALANGMPAAEQEILDLTAQIADLKNRAEEIKSGRRSFGTGWELANRKNAVLFLEDVSGEARRVGVNLVAIHPSQKVDKQNYQEVAMNLDLKGRYRELAEYFQRIESLPRVVNIRKIRLESCPDTASVCAAQVEAVTFMTN